MIPVKHIDPDDLPLYAMQLLPPEEAEEMSLHLQHSVEARRVLSEIYGELAFFAHSAEMHSPPALARHRLMKHVAREKKVVPAAEPEPVTSASHATPTLVEAPAPRGLAARTLPWIGWALAAGLAAEVFLLHTHESRLQTTVALQTLELNRTRTSAEASAAVVNTVKDPSAVHVMLTGTGLRPPPQGSASYVADRGSLVFLASNMAPLEPYKIYELWIIPVGGHDPIPAGTFRPDSRGNASVLLPPLPKGVPAAKLAVTVEDGEGSSQPTMPLILSGNAA